MPFDITCTNCSRLLRVPDDGAGKHVKCPQCQNVLLAPKPNGNSSAATGSSAGKTSSVELWHMKGADGQTYGPVPRGELDNWCKEGRLAANSQILRDGASQWQWATDLYPHLVQTAPVGGSHSAGSPYGGGSYGAGYGSAATSGANPFGEVAANPAYSPYGGGQVTPYNSGGYNPGGYNPGGYNPGGYGYAGSQQLSDKSKIAAGILGLFLGDIGIHRFYLGDVGIGIAQIVVTIATCGIGGLWGKIEGIMILCGAIDRDAYGRKLRD